MEASKREKPDGEFEKELAGPGGKWRKAGGVMSFTNTDQYLGSELRAKSQRGEVDLHFADLQPQREASDYESTHKSGNQEDSSGLAI